MRPAGKRKREFTIYATAPGLGFSTKSADYSSGTHRWIYTVCATSIKQAYFLAGSQSFAADAHSVGIRRLESADDRVLAPYLRTTGAP